MVKPGRQSTSALVRLTLYVERHGPDECWPFVNRARNDYGYGLLWDGRVGRKERAHRLAYEAAFGPIDPGICVLHKCDNPPCCNPAHLFTGTRADNNADARSKGRASGNHARGLANPNGKLTDDQVEAIRMTYAKGGVSQKALGATFGVTQAQIWNIVNNRQRTALSG